THAKICLVVRRERDGIRRYVHLSTGNYNSITARIYTDVGLMTSDDEIGADATELFNFLTGYSRQKVYRKFWVAPVTMRDQILAQIEAETAHGREGHIIMKINHLVDARLIQALYRASQAGVKVELMIRGICCLRPGILGVSDNITVTCTIGRFLEHSRIYYFHNKGDENVFMGSADLMPRNLDRRVEVICPIEAPELRQEIIENILNIYRQDAQNGYKLMPNGEYVRLSDEMAGEEEAFGAQKWYLTDRQTVLHTAGFGQMKAD
ncbi:MAG: hypothetical protein KDD89_11010, partial [Anaerolineales bacterium]|nr:hypothetical protein [Anaerolineales bacterium]